MGWVGPNSLDWISEVLSLTGGAVNTTALAASGLTCATVSGCEAAHPVTVWAVNLGWQTEVELMESETLGTFFAILVLPHEGGGNPGYELECTVLGVKSSDECTATIGAIELKLEGTNLLGNFSEAFTELAGLKLGNCSLGGTETGVIEGEGTITLAEGGELTASSEGVVS